MPRILDESGKSQGDEETLLWLKTDSEHKVAQRVAEHLSYLTAPMLQVVFSAVHSPQLRSVRLIITKLDLLQRAFDLGYFSFLQSSDMVETIQAKFSTCERDIRRACAANNISDFSVHFVSSTQDIGTRKLRTDIWKTHLKAIGVQI